MKSKPKTSRKKGKKNYIKFALIVGSTFVGVLVLFVFGFAAVVQMTPLDKGKLEQMSSPTVVYARDGSAYMTISAPGSSNLPYENIPKNLQDALVATEDHNFWHSSGIDVHGILRAAFIDLWTRSRDQGASTVQQQLAKIVYLNDDKTLKYKFQEIVLGLKINQQYTKQEILTMYFNRVFLGENSVGVQQAAWRYFGVDLLQHPDSLTLEQAALLAGLPKAPSAYDPLQHPDNALKRRNQVLENMVKYGYITRAQADAAEKQPVGATYHSSTDGWDAHPLFTSFLFDAAAQQGISREELLQGGMKIYTTVDPATQNAVEQVFWSGNYAHDFPTPINGKGTEGAAVFVDPKTGGIMGGAGSRKSDYYRDGLDRAFSYSQPGSSIKPIMEYAPAIESGNWNPNSILINYPHDFGNGYIPYNDDPSAPAKVTLHDALVTSQNVASVYLLQNIGINAGTSFAENDGINSLTANDRQSLPIAIGGMEKGVTPYEMAQAYEAFANGGVQMQEHLINRVIGPTGSVIYQYQSSSKQVMSAQTAAVMTQLMQDVVRRGTGQSAQISGWDVAGKTGTVQWDFGKSRSHPEWISRAWFDGYTPNMVGAVYIGYDTPHDPVYHLFWSSGPNHYSAMIFSDVVRMAEAGVTPQHFDVSTPSTQPPTQSQNGVVGLSAAWDPIGNGVQLTWQTGITGDKNFIVSRSTAPGNTDLQLIGQTSGLSYEDPSAQPGQSYTYYVQATDSTGQFIGSAATVTFTVPASSGNTGPGNSGVGNDTGTGGSGGNATDNSSGGSGNYVNGTGGNDSGSGWSGNDTANSPSGGGTDNSGSTGNSATGAFGGSGNTVDGNNPWGQNGTQ